MSPLRNLDNLRRNLFSQPRIDGDLDDELRAHLDLVAEEEVKFIELTKLRAPAAI